MSKKKKQQLLWSNLLWGAIAEFVLYGLVILMVTFFAVRGSIPINRCNLLLAVGALVATLIAGSVWGRRTPVKGWGCILCSVILTFALLLGNLSFEDGIAMQGIPIILCVFLGGVASTILTGKKKHRTKKLRKVNL